MSVTGKSLNLEILIMKISVKDFITDYSALEFSYFSPAVKVNPEVLPQN
jgi:hypothetical protein